MPPKELDYLPSVLAHGPIAGRSAKLSNFLKQNRDRVVAGYRIEGGPRDAHLKVGRYVLRPVDMREGTRLDTVSTPVVTEEVAGTSARQVQASSDDADFTSE